MKITQTQAREVCARIDMAQGNVARASGVCAYELRAIAPFTDRHLSGVKAVIDFIARAEPARQARLVAQIAAITEQAEHA